MNACYYKTVDAGVLAAHTNFEAAKDALIEKAKARARVKRLEETGAIDWREDQKEWVAKCVACGEKTPIWCDPEEFDPDYHYCGGSPRCCP